MYKFRPTHACHHPHTALIRVAVHARPPKDHHMKRIILSVVAAVAVAGCGAAGSGGNDPDRASNSTAKVEPVKLDLTALERQIKPELRKQLTELGGYPVTIDSLDCIEKD